MRKSGSIGWNAGLMLAVVTGPGLVTASVAAQTPPPNAAAGEPISPAPKLDRAGIDALLATPDKVVFVDVRRPDEISAIGGLPAYLNIPLSDLERLSNYIPRDRQVATVSNHAARAVKAAALLARQGFRVAGAIGVQNYLEEGGALYGQKIVTPAIPGVVAADTRVDVVREGFEGTEGPVAQPDGGILFTENRADRIVRIAPDNSVSTHLSATGGANALAVSAKGELLAAQTAPAAIAILSPTRKVLASDVGGKAFNRPNDLALARSGNIYFSDPGAAPQQGAPAPAVKPAFYRLDPRGKVTLVADDIRRPNGVALSPDERTVYLANTAGPSLLAFTVKPDGSLTERRDFAQLAGFRETPNGPSSGADGIAVDGDGRVYVATSAGVEIFGAGGEALGVIALPHQPQNLAFSGKNRSVLYVVGRGSVYRIPTLTHGVDRPSK